MNSIDATHDPALRSFVESANRAGHDFPIQNLPFGRFREVSGQAWRIGVAIGDQVLDLQRAGLVDHGDMNRLMQATPQQRRALRTRDQVQERKRDDEAQACRQQRRHGVHGQLDPEPGRPPGEADDGEEDGHDDRG